MKNNKMKNLGKAIKITGKELPELTVLSLAARGAAGLFTDNELIKGGVQIVVGTLIAAKKAKEAVDKEDLEERIALLEAKIEELEK